MYSIQFFYLENEGQGHWWFVWKLNGKLSLSTCMCAKIGAFRFRISFSVTFRGRRMYAHSTIAEHRSTESDWCNNIQVHFYEMKFKKWPSIGSYRPSGTVRLARKIDLPNDKLFSKASKDICLLLFNAFPHEATEVTTGRGKVQFIRWWCQKVFHLLPDTNRVWLQSKQLILINTYNIQSKKILFQLNLLQFKHDSSS